MVLPPLRAPINCSRRRTGFTAAALSSSRSTAKSVNKPCARGECAIGVTPRSAHLASSPLVSGPLLTRLYSICRHVFEIQVCVWSD